MPRRQRHDDAHYPQPRRRASERGLANPLVPWVRGGDVVMPTSRFQWLLSKARRKMWACLVTGMDRKTARHEAIDALAEELRAHALCLEGEG